MIQYPVQYGTVPLILDTVDVINHGKIYEYSLFVVLYQPSFKIKILRAVYDAYSPIIRGVPTYGMCCISCTASHRYDGMTV